LEADGDDDDVAADKNDDDGVKCESVVASAVENESSMHSSRSCDEGEGDAKVAGDDVDALTSGGAITVDGCQKVKQQTLANHCIPVLKCVPVKFFSIIIRQMAAASEQAIFSSELLEEDGLSGEVDGLVDEADAAWALAVSVSVSAYWSISSRSPPPSSDRARIPTSRERRD
jgi:hypothetical protein